MSEELEQIKEARWYILRTCNELRPGFVSERVVREAISDELHTFNKTELRRELEYLEDRRCLEIERDPAGPWRVKLSRLGVDIVEYSVECLPGITRPQKRD